MRIFYSYNEILPTRRAHDTYVVLNCASLAEQGLDVTLMLGVGAPDREGLASHYGFDPQAPLQIAELPILRRNNRLNLSWNFVFFGATQRMIARHHPDIVITSVNKQGIYHHERKLRGTKYVFEVHELLWYPDKQKGDARAIAREGAMLAEADLIVVTTPALQRILRDKPYGLTNPIEVIPLGVTAQPLGPKKVGTPRRAAYVGQLYPVQGVDLIVEAMGKTQDLHLDIIGGSEKDIAKLKHQAIMVGAEERITFHGFQPPSRVQELLATADLTVMPTRTIASRAYVAHTKLLEYTHWGRPVLVPDIDAVDEEIGDLPGMIRYEANSAESLAAALEGPLPPYIDRGTPFSWEARSQSYAPLLRSLVSSS